MKLTIRAKLLIGFTLLLALSSLIQALTFSITRDYSNLQINNIQKIETNNGAAAIQNFFSGLQTIDLGLARTYRTNASASAKVNLATVTQYVISNNDNVREITYLSPNGKELLKFDQNGQLPQDTLSNEVFSGPLKTAATGKTAFSKTYFPGKELGPQIDIFSPIFSRTNKVIGVIRMQVSLEQLRKVIGNIRYGENGYLYVVDTDGTLIAHPSLQYILARPNLSSRNVVKAALHSTPVGHAYYSYKNEKNIPVIAQGVKVPGLNWIAVFEQPESEAFGFVSFIRNLFLLTLGESLILLLIISLVFSNNLTSAITRLRRAIQEVEKGKKDTNIIVRSGDEIESLSYSFASMITQLWQRENSLRKEKQETETLLQSLTDGVVALDQDNTIIAFNKTAEQLIGLSALQVLGKPVDSVLHVFCEDEQLPLSQYNQLSDEDSRKLKEKGMHIINQHNEKIAINLTTSPIVFGTKQTGTIITFQDISKEEQLEEMKLDFVSMAAHELRTPLTAIRGYASLLDMQQKDKLDDAGKESITRLLISSTNLGNLIDNLLNVSRIERNMFTVDASPVDLTKTVREVYEGMLPQATTKKQDLTLTISDTLPIVFADAFRVGQVLTNLVANAINYTPPGGKITITAQKKDDVVEISVADTGEGIPKEALPKLFSKFFRVSGSLEQGSKGTGLGLFISKSIITLLKGKIWVESELGKGSTFTFSFSVATPEQIASFQNQQSSSLTVKNGQGIIVRSSKK